MKKNINIARFRQQGSIAIEAGLIVSFILIPLLAFSLVFANFFWQYTAVQKALHDGTLYMSMAPLSEIKNQSAVRLASYIIASEIAEIGSSMQVAPEIYCGYKVAQNSNYVAIRTCNDASVPFVVYISALLTINEPLLFRGGPIQLIVPVTLRYVGR